MKKFIVFLTLFGITFSSAMARQLQPSASTTEEQGEHDTTEQSEEQYNKCLEDLHLQNNEDLIECERKKEKKPIEKESGELEGEIFYPTLRPATGPYLKK